MAAYYDRLAEAKEKLARMPEVMTDDASDDTKREAQATAR
jgi:hypothetical protein